MFYTFFWFNIPLPEDQHHLPFHDNRKIRLNSKSIVESVLERNFFLEFSEVQLHVLSIFASGNSMFNKRKQIDSRLLEVYKEIYSNFGFSHGVAYLLDWDEQSCQTTYQYEFLRFENGVHSKEFVNFDFNRI